VTERLLAPLSDELVGALRAVRYGAFLVMAVFTDEVGAQSWDRVYGAVTPGLSFDFLFNHANPLRTGRRSPGGSFMMYTGGPRAAEMMETLEDREVERRYLGDLYGLLPETRSHVKETFVQRWPLGNIVATPGRARAQAVLERGVPGGRVMLAGDYFAQLGGMEPAARTGEAAAERIRKNLIADELAEGADTR
jgi:oxygen-dependent protoporphyrinogen oxidase